jgi:hypothetical protein
LTAPASATKGMKLVKILHQIAMVAEFVAEHHSTVTLTVDANNTAAANKMLLETAIAVVVQTLVSKYMFQYT